GEGTIFKHTEGGVIAYQNGHVHFHTRVALYAGSLNNPTFTEEQNKRLLLTTVGQIIFNEIIPETFPYINEPTNSNLEIETPEKYFPEKGADVKAEIKSREIVPPFAKGILGDIIAEVFKLYQISETSKMLDR